MFNTIKRGRFNKDYVYLEREELKALLERLAARDTSQVSIFSRWKKRG